MSSEETGGDKRVVELLEKAAAEIRAGRAVETSTWQRREPELAPDFPELLETLRDLVTAAHTWKTGAELGGFPGCEPETIDEYPQEAVTGSFPEQIGRYRILEQIGAGGMGAVYKAYDPELDRVVAVKVPRFERLADLGDPSMQTGVKQRFLREARTAAQVRQAHVCPIHDVGEHDGIPFVVMAYVEGQSLSRRLKGSGRFADPREAAELVRQVADGLAAVHGHGILHRDVKPGNILIDLAGQALLTDFGLALPVNDPEHLTSTGVAVGTVAYMAPEQADTEHGAIGPWTDLYSLSVVLYQMVTGRLPFEGPPLAVLSRIAHEVPPLPTKVRPDLDPALEAIINKAMAGRAEERYRSAPEFAEALRGWLTGSEAEPAATSATVPTQTSTPVVVRSDLSEGSTVTVSVQPGSTAARKVSVTINEQECKRRRRRLTIQVSLAFGVLLLVIGAFQWYSVTKTLPAEGEPVRERLQVATSPKETKKIASTDADAPAFKKIEQKKQEQDQAVMVELDQKQKKEVAEQAYKVAEQAYKAAEQIASEVKKRTEQQAKGIQKAIEQEKRRDATEPVVRSWLAAAVNLDRVNTPNDDDEPHVASNNLRLYYTLGEKGKYQVMQSVRKKANQPWPPGSPVAEVNIHGDNRSVFVTDTLKYPQYLFFATNKDPDKSEGRGDNFDIFFLIKLNPKADFTNPTPLHSISTAADEMHPWLSRDRLKIYFSRKDQDGWHTYVAGRQKEHEQFDMPGRLDFPPDFHHPTLTPDGKTMYLQGPLPGKRWGIFRSYQEGESWSSPEPVLALNHPDAPRGDSSPTLSHDGSKLYFASDRPGTKGGLDLWVVPVEQLVKR